MPEPEKITDPSDPNWGRRSRYWIKRNYRNEWTCEHGIGHGNHIHGCDGCCRGENYPGKQVIKMIVPGDLQVYRLHGSRRFGMRMKMTFPSRAQQNRKRDKQENSRF